ncbi:MAG TPA: glycosyltransferase [Thermoanaerobaculia bacterium]|nr:glycosyltransferase [Thermoanaerobaculia bacterium]
MILPPSAERLDDIPRFLEESLRDEDVVYALHRGESCQGHEPANGNLTPGCTIVICTYRRPESLARFLDSLPRHGGVPEAVVIVDASPDDATQRLISEDASLESRTGCILYLRVGGRWKGLTRQRNFAVRWVQTDLLAFFDDDVVLLPGCLSEMQRVHRALGAEVAGVGAITHNEGPEPRRRPLWRLRRLLGIVATLEPGRYSRSGMSTPWGALPAETAPLEGDWLPGCGMMWKTSTVADLGFNNAFQGYSLGEDIDFSLRARRRGKLIMAPAARLLHLQPTGGRLDGFELGYFTIYNRYEVHRRGLSNRNWPDVVAFAYAWSVDTLMLFRHLAFPQRARSTFGQLRGRLHAARDLVRKKDAKRGAESQKGH